MTHMGGRPMAAMAMGPMGAMAWRGMGRGATGRGAMSRGAMVTTAADVSSAALRDAGLLILRAGVGGVLVAHGCQKLFGWFGGGGLKGTAKGFEAMGFRPGVPSAVAAGLGEAGGGALMLLGLATPVAGAAATGTMVAASAVHFPAFFAMKGGYEYAALLGVSTAALALTGPGDWSLDALLGHRLNQPWMSVVGLVASVVAATAVLQRRARAVAATADPEVATVEGEPEG